MADKMKIDGFDWDFANLVKCQKHGVGIAEIEALFRSGNVLILPDLTHSLDEERLKAVGRTSSGRMVFLGFTLRSRDGLRLARPITARYMHRKEIDDYEKTIPRPDDR